MASAGVAEDFNLLSKNSEESNEHANPQEESFDKTQSMENSEFRKLELDENSGELLEDLALM
jgi:hypothetical protein